MMKCLLMMDRIWKNHVYQQFEYYQEVMQHTEQRYGKFKIFWDRSLNWAIIYSHLLENWGNFPIFQYLL